MKLLIAKDVFLEKIFYASRFTSSRLSSLAALQGVYIKGEKNTLHFYATNLNSYYHTQLKTESTNEFIIVVEPKKISEFLSLLPAGKINLEIEKNQIIISQEKTKGEFATFSTTEFPLPPKLEEKPQKIDASFFLKNLPLVLFAASTDETRPVLTGVNFMVEEEQMLMVATDGFRLSLLKLKKEAGFPSMVVPAGFFTEALHLMKEEKKTTFNYSAAEKIINFQIGEHDLYSRLIEGEYPPFEKVIPAEVKTTIVVDREELLTNIRLVAIFARDAANIVLVQTEKDSLVLRPKGNKESKGAAFQEAEIKGEEIQIAFNFKFLLDLLNHLTGEKITIELVRPDAPAVFKSNAHPGFLHIIMPVRIQE